MNSIIDGDSDTKKNPLKQRLSRTLEQIEQQIVQKKNVTNDTKMYNQEALDSISILSVEDMTSLPHIDTNVNYQCVHTISLKYKIIHSNLETVQLLL